MRKARWKPNESKIMIHNVKKVSLRKSWYSMAKVVPTYRRQYIKTSKVILRPKY